MNEYSILEPLVAVDDEEIEEYCKRFTYFMQEELHKVWSHVEKETKNSGKFRGSVQSSNSTTIS